MTGKRLNACQQAYEAVERSERVRVLPGQLPGVQPKCDLASLELPLFALKSGDTRSRVYRDTRQSVEIIPSVLGAASQFDKDVLIYCISQLVASADRSGVSGVQVNTTAYAILEFSHRGFSGSEYKRLLDALARLRATTIRTDRRAGSVQFTEGFGLIEAFRVRRDLIERAQMSSIEITVSPWIASAIREREVLTLSTDYFLLRSPLARRVYELARKHCGNQPCWSVGLIRLYEKSGSRATVREFRRQLAELMRAGTIPDYDFEIDKERQLVHFWRRGTRASMAAISRLFTEKDLHRHFARPRRSACGTTGG